MSSVAYCSSERRSKITLSIEYINKLFFKNEMTHEMLSSIVVNKTLSDDILQFIITKCKDLHKMNLFDDYPWMYQQMNIMVIKRLLINNVNVSYVNIFDHSYTDDLINNIPTSNNKTSNRILFMMFNNNYKYIDMINEYKDKTNINKQLLFDRYLLIIILLRYTICGPIILENILSLT
jgi:hypothetical protein